MGESALLLHDDEVPVDVALVERLLAAQLPQWSDLAIVPVAVRGTVNAVFRLGSQLSVRLPIRLADPDEVGAWLAREAAAAVELAAASPVPTPTVVAVGRPGCGYPMPWAVQTWIPGSNPGQIAAESTDFAADVAGFIGAMRTVDTHGRRHSGPTRGGTLARHDGWVQECLSRSTGLIDVAAAAKLWTGLRELPPPSHQVMAHGDLVPGNVLVDAANRLCGVIDAGGFGPADPAVELVAAWHLLEAGPRSVLRESLGCDDREWLRGMAWALEQSLGLVWYYRDSHPSLAQAGQRTLHRILNRD